MVVSVVGPTIVGAALVGCTTNVHPPAALTEPTTVWIVDYGRHASLLLPQNSSRLVEFEYGEWRWFALDETQWWRAAWVNLVPCQGALARRDISAPATDELLRERLKARSLIALQVEGPRMSQLRERLEARFEAGAATMIHNTRYELDFVKDPSHYWAWHNCHTVVRGWLRELGCRVEGPWPAARYLLIEPRDRPEQPSEMPIPGLEPGT